MEIAERKLTLNDLYIGMEIKDKNQLSNIYDMWILLVKNKDSDYYIRFCLKSTSEKFSYHIYKF